MNKMGKLRASKEYRIIKGGEEGATCDKTPPPPVGQGLLTVKALRSHSDTPHSVGLLWTIDQPVAETSTRQHTTMTRDRNP